MAGRVADGWPHERSLVDGRVVRLVGGGLRVRPTWEMRGTRQGYGLLGGPTWGAPEARAVRTGLGRNRVLRATLDKSITLIVIFGWDPAKAAANHRKHGVTFEEAMTCFADIHARYYPDRSHHDRFVLIGCSFRGRLIYTVHAEHEDDHIRIISARLATRKERRRYEEED